MTTGMSAEDAFGMLMPVDAATYRSPGYALQVPVMFGDMPIITPDTIARAHALGMEVHAWTIDDPACPSSLKGGPSAPSSPRVDAGIPVGSRFEYPRRPRGPRRRTR
jgi:hypothetical protein